MIPTMYLRSVEIFDGLSDDELKEVGKACKEVDLGEETTLFEENDSADSLYSLVDGEVSLRYRMPAKGSDKENTISTLDPGGTFGWSSLLPPQKYNVAAYCTDKNCKAIRIDRDALIGVLESNHSIGYKVMKTLTAVISRQFMLLRDEVVRQIGQNKIDGW
jgi:toluene monooxygenase system ferredoxin subunit